MGHDVVDTEAPMLGTKPNQQDGEKFRQYVAAISVSLGAVCAGTALAWTSPALAQLCNETNSTTNGGGLHLSDHEGAMVGGILPIGALVAAIPAGCLADRIGRRLVILLLAAAFLLHWLLILAATNATTLIVGRFFAGVGTGAICVTAPIYIGEIAETSIRGVLSSLFQLFLCIGIFFTCTIGAFASWTALSAALAVVPVVFGLSFYFMPETPAYLVKVNQVELAGTVLRSLRGYPYDVEVELKDIQKEVEEARQNSVSIGDIFSSRANRMALIAAIGILAFQQLSGINAVVFYTVQIFEAAGSTLPPFVAGIIIALVQLLVSYVSILVIEKANRKFYLMLSSTGMLTFLTGLGMYFHLKSIDGYELSGIGFVPIGSAVLFMVSFSIGYGPVPWLLLGELFSPEIKGVASGFAILTNWSFAFLVTFFFPIMNRYWGAHVTFYLFAIVMAFATVFVYFCIPETRGKSLIEIQRILNKS